MHHRILLARLAYVALFLIAVCCYLLIGGFDLPRTAQTSQITPLPFQSVAVGTGGAVATVDPFATQVGIDILSKGGNAIDAAVATAAALGVVEPFSCGIGGGDFMLIKRPSRILSLDGREQAPASASPDMFQDPNSATGDNLPFFPNRISSGVAVGVPGALQVWAEALERYGTLSLAEALAPAIALAQNGFTVDQTFHDHVAQNQERFAAFTSTRDLYLPDGGPPEVGSVFKNPDMAHTYRLVAEQGLNAFYRGEIGEAIAHTVQHPPSVENPPFPVIPGGMTTADLDDYHVRVRPPVSTTYRGYDIYGMGLPSSGGITSLLVLNLLDGYDLGNMDRADAWHRVIEAERLAYGDRNAYLGDPEYVDVPVTGLLSKDYAQSRRAIIGDQAPANEPEVRAAAGNPLPYQSDPSPSLTELNMVQAKSQEGPSTTHLTVADRWGNVVSHTLTIESTGGSGIVVPHYGFLLNNELTDFDAVQPHPNSPEPGKRPRSSMAPTIALGPDGSVLAFGSPGGSTIITTVLGITVNMLDFGLPLADAIAAPRISQRNSGSTLVDSAFESTEVGQALMQKGHSFRSVSQIGAATGVVVAPDGTMTAAAEPLRRDGGDARVVDE
ncbi:MAG: gamma-glutamyltransferase [Cyanobacteria bacterium P01_F01_bin.150]